MANLRKCTDCGKEYIVSIMDTRENYYCPACDKNRQRMKKIERELRKQAVMAARQKNRRQAQ